LGAIVQKDEKKYGRWLQEGGKLRSALGNRTVAELQAQVLVAENRIVGIRAQLDYDLKILVAKEIGIDRALLVIGDHLLFQAGSEAVSRVLKGEEFVEL
jgi:hypothetical protein